ncbi:hypothetical protein G7059_03070 [Erysipelothrix sp. HDW6A]|uniref:hypothetical protein n=1 Tax=Erysipelothrix sp. HDW6A TaxID=2714928 RepID=UPI00140D1E9C|nr:hypothetical protein [Erysipelothrix sp. HDW6A]QIK56901.1 hypothetical protein G7059_03070 [Erysipelothrix sp. HDW6A]
MNDISVVDKEMLKGLKSLLKKVFSESKKEEAEVNKSISVFNDDNEWYGDVDPTTLRVFDGVSYDEDGNEYDVSESEQYYAECRRKFYAANETKEEKIDENNKEIKSGDTAEARRRRMHHLRLYFESLDEDVEMFEEKDVLQPEEYLSFEDDFLEPELFQFLIRDSKRNDYYRKLRDADYANVKLEIMERQDAEELKMLGILRTKKMDA